MTRGMSPSYSRESCFAQASARKCRWTMAIPSSVRGVALQLSTSIEERSQVGGRIKLAFPNEREDLGATARGFEHLERLGEASEVNVVETARIGSRLGFRRRD